MLHISSSASFEVRSSIKEECVVQRATYSALRNPSLTVSVWYCRRKRREEDAEKPWHFDFDPAVDSVADPPPGSARNGGRRSAQILAMDDPAAWTQAYTSANPQQLDSRSVHLNDEAAAAENGSHSPRGVDQSVSVLSMSDGSRRTVISSPGSPYSAEWSPTRTRGYGEEGMTDLVLKPAPLARSRRSYQSVAELPA